MLPAYSDTILLSLLGAVYLEIASIVMISALTLNISLNTIINMLIINNNNIIDRKEFKFFLFKISIFFSIAYLLLSITAYHILSEDIKVQSFLYLILSIFRPILSCANSYYREKLFTLKENKTIHSSMNISIGLYIISSWSIIFTLNYFNYNISIIIFLIPTYISIFFNNIFYRKNNNMKFFEFNLSKIIVNNFQKSFNAGLLNAFEIFFFALVAWVASIKFNDISQYIYPVFNLVELASAFAIGINRVLSERLTKKNINYNLNGILIIYFFYSLLVVKIYFIVMELIGSQNFSTYLIIFAMFYVFIDGLQLIYRSYVQVVINEKFAMSVICFLYATATVILALSFFRESQNLLIISIIFPVVLLIFFINGYNYVKNK